MLDAIEQANATGSTALIFQVKSQGAIDVDVHRVIRAIDRSQVPIIFWVGPSGADAKGATTLLLQSAHLAFISPNSGAGPANPVLLDDPDAQSDREVSNELAALARKHDRDPQGARRLATERLGSQEASDVGATNGVRPTIGELIVRLDGKTVTTKAGDIKLSTAKVIGNGRDRRRQPNQVVRFNRLNLGGQLLHRLISPSIAYFLLIAGPRAAGVRVLHRVDRPRGPGRRCLRDRRVRRASRTCRSTGGRSGSCSSPRSGTRSTSRPAVSVCGRSSPRSRWPRARSGSTAARRNSARRGGSSSSWAAAWCCSCSAR